MKVTQILAQKGSNAVETIAATASVSDAVARLSEKKIGALVVSDGKTEIAGILSERDIVKALGAEGPGALSKPVSELMTSAVMSCAMSDTAHSVLERMTQGRFRHMPVVDGGKMVGLLSIGDVVKARMDEIELENREMSTMLAG